MKFSIYTMNEGEGEPGYILVGPFRAAVAISVQGGSIHTVPLPPHLTSVMRTVAAGKASPADHGMTQLGLGALPPIVLLHLCEELLEWVSAVDFMVMPERGIPSDANASARVASFVEELYRSVSKDGHAVLKRTDGDNLLVFRHSDISRVAADSTAPSAVQDLLDSSMGSSFSFPMPATDDDDDDGTTVH